MDRGGRHCKRFVAAKECEIAIDKASRSSDNFSWSNRFIHTQPSPECWHQTSEPTEEGEGGGREKERKIGITKCTQAD